MDKKNKAKLLQVRVSDDDLARLKAAADRKRLNVSAWLRALALEEADKVLGPVDSTGSTTEPDQT